MRKYLILCFLFCCFSTLKAQTTDTIRKAALVSTGMGDKIFSSVDGPLQFAGGIDSLNSYFSKNITYPQQLLDKHKDGVSILNFVIEKDGSVSNITVSGAADAEFNAEAVRVVSPLKFIAARQHDMPVRLMFRLGIVFDHKNPQKHL